MVSVKYIEKECECGLKQGMNPINCSYCKSFAKSRTLGEIPIRAKNGR